MEIDKQILEKIIKQVLEEEKSAKILKFTPAKETIDESNRLDTSNPNDRVYTKDLLTTQQSPNLGFGVMEMEKTTFDWSLNYDEIDVVLEGQLRIIHGSHIQTAEKNEVIFIPKGSKIQFSAPEYAKFVYITYPADWENA